MNFLELKIPPAIATMLFGAMMWFAKEFSPALTLAIPDRNIMGVTISSIGIALILAGAVTFRAVKTTVNPMQPSDASTLVTRSVYKISRNPMYIGFLLILLSWAVMLSHILSFALLPAFVWYMNRFQIIPEERALLSKFGTDYAAYMKNVRRWL